MGAAVRTTSKRGAETDETTAQRGQTRAPGSSVQDLLQRLQALVAEVGCRLGREAPSLALRRLAARTADGDEDRVRVLNVREVAYVFKGHAAATHLVRASWPSTQRIHPDRVYVRTRDGVFVTAFRSVAEIRKRLPQTFLALHQSVLVNVDWIDAMDTSGAKVCLVGVRANGTTEWLGLSRRALGPLRQSLGLRRRPRRGSRRSGSVEQQ